MFTFMKISTVCRPWQWNAYLDLFWCCEGVSSPRKGFCNYPTHLDSFFLIMYQFFVLATPKNAAITLIDFFFSLVMASFSYLHQYIPWHIGIHPVNQLPNTNPSLDISSIALICFICLEASRKLTTTDHEKVCQSIVWMFFSA